MDALILSCSTGGGHNAAGYALKEELLRRGHNVTMMDPYDLAGKNLGQFIGSCYVKLTQKLPCLFGLIYQLGELYRRLPLRSPVYWANTRMIEPMRRYLEENHFDVILMPHIFPGEILAAMKERGIPLPKTILIATDYTCIPFTEETDCDYYVIPSSRLTDTFTSKGIAASKIRPLGIPVQRAFLDTSDRRSAIRRLHLNPDKRYLLLTGGSIGAGNIWYAIHVLKEYLKKQPDDILIVICGSNRALYRRLKKYYGKNKQILLLTSTRHMADYLRASDLLISKPGGLTATEAAVSGIPLIHLSPIPGCESKNMQFFAEHGMSLRVGKHTNRLVPAIKRLQNGNIAAQMRMQQRKEINPSAAKDIISLAEQITGSDDTSPSSN